jgi:hypothetical protein
MFWLYHDGEWVVQWSNTKAAAHAVPSADAVRVVKKLKR